MPNIDTSTRKPTPKAIRLDDVRSKQLRPVIDDLQTSAGCRSVPSWDGFSLPVPRSPLGITNGRLENESPQLRTKRHLRAFARAVYPGRLTHALQTQNEAQRDLYPGQISAKCTTQAPSRGTATPACTHGLGPILPRAILDTLALQAPFTRLREGRLPRPSDMVRGHFYLGRLHTARKGRLPRPSAPPTFKRWERGLRSGFDEFERQTQVISLRRIPQTPIDIFESITHRAQTRHYAYAPRIILDRQQLRIDRARP